MLRIFRFIKALYKAYIKDELAGLSAQVAYFLLLSIFPFLLFLMTLITKSPLQDVDIFRAIWDIFSFVIPIAICHDGNCFCLHIQVYPLLTPGLEGAPAWSYLYNSWLASSLFGLFLLAG